jgi:gluconolactonase
MPNARPAELLSAEEGVLNMSTPPEADPVRIEVIADGLGFTEGPACLPDGRIALTSISHGCVYIVDPAGGPMDRIHTGGGPNGLAVGSNGEIYVAQNGGIFGASGAAEAGVQLIRDGRVDYLAQGMDAPNDLVIGPDGRLWVTDTRAQLDFSNPDPNKPGWVWTVETSTGEKELLLDSGPVFINGLGFSPDAALLMVTTTSGAQLWSYRLGPAAQPDKASAEVLCTFDGGWPDGMAVCADGTCWVALTGGHRLDLVDQHGHIVDTVTLPDGALPTNVCLNTERADELYVTAAFHQAVLRIGRPKTYR